MVFSIFLVSEETDLVLVIFGCLLRFIVLIGVPLRGDVFDALIVIFGILFCVIVLFVSCYRYGPSSSVILRLSIVLILISDFAISCY